MNYVTDVVVKIWKWLKLLNFVPFIKKTRVNHVYNRIWWFWLTFAFLQWMMANFKITQFSKFLLKSDYAVLVRIWKWLKLHYSVLLIKKRCVNHVNNRIWSYWLIFTVSQSITTNFKISQSSKFLLSSWYAIFVKIQKWLKLLNCVPFIKKTCVNHAYNWVWSFWLNFTVLQWMKTILKISQFSRFLLRCWNTNLGKFEND